MKVNLMYQEQDFVFNEKERQDDTLIKDLELDRILEVMSGKDLYVKAVCTKVLLTPLATMEEINFRQEIARDCLEHPEEVRQLYAFCDKLDEKKRAVWGILSSVYSSATFSNAVEIVQIYMNGFKKICCMIDQKIQYFHSKGFLNFSASMKEELPDEYIEDTFKLLKELKNEKEMYISAQFGENLQGVFYTYRRKTKSDTYLRWLIAPVYTIADRDERGEEDISRRKDKAIDEAANALAQTAEHMEHFFEQLKCETAFYVGIINLYENIKKLGLPFCFPEMTDPCEKTRSWTDLGDLSLALLKQSKIVGNQIEPCKKQLYIITGANQGGKTTFLRSIGQAQLMAQSGMFVCASQFQSPIKTQIYTHFKKEEDTTIKSGRLDEEMDRMSKIVDVIQKHALVLFNESFSSTNEREGSKIFQQITEALLESEIEIFSVTHLYTYAMEFQKEGKAEYLIAERKENGERSFSIVPGVPKETAFSKDIYKKIFG